MKDEEEATRRFDALIAGADVVVIDTRASDEETK